MFILIEIHILNIYLIEIMFYVCRKDERMGMVCAWERYKHEKELNSHDLQRIFIKNGSN